MKHSTEVRWLGAWLALIGLVLQVALSTAHSARNFDHLVGPLGTADPALAGAEPYRSSAVPLPEGPAAPDQDRCAVDFGLAAVGNAVLAAPALVPLLLSFEIARLAGPSQAIFRTDHRHRLPPSRAPPVIEILA